MKKLLLVIMIVLLVGCSKSESYFELDQPIEKEVGSDAVTLGNDLIKIDIPNNSLSETQKITIDNATDYKEPKGDEAEILSAPIQLSCEQDIKRFNEPIEITMTLTDDDISKVESPDDLYGAYYDSDQWYYIKPKLVDLEEKIMIFETYHFSLFSKAVPSQEEKMKTFAKLKAVSTLQNAKSGSIVGTQTENMIKDILQNKLGITDNTLEKDVYIAIVSQDDYGSLLSNYESGDIESFTQGLAVLTGKAVFEKVGASASLLGTISENSSKIGTGVAMAAAISEGDLEGAAKALSLEIADNYPTTKLFKAAAAITENQINRWKDQEIEAAYQVFRNGAESKVPFWGYNVEKENFEALWTQMRGIQTKIYDDAIDKYALIHNLDKNTMDASLQNQIRSDAKKSLEEDFKYRLDNEDSIDRNTEANMQALDEFERAGLFKRGMYGYTDQTTFEFRMERLFKVRTLILRETRAKTGLNMGNSIADRTISSQTIADLTRLYYSTDGKKLFKEKIIELGYVEEKKDLTPLAQPVLVNSSEWHSGEINGIYKFIGNIPITLSNNSFSISIHETSGSYPTQFYLRSVETTAIIDLIDIQYTWNEATQTGTGTFKYELHDYVDEGQGMDRRRSEFVVTCEGTITGSSNEYDRYYFGGDAEGVPHRQHELYFEGKRETTRITYGNSQNRDGTFNSVKFDPETTTQPYTNFMYYDINEYEEDLTY